MLNEYLVFAIQRTTDNANNVVIMHDNPTAVLNQLSQELENVEKVRRTNDQEELQMSTGAWVKVIRWTHRGRGFVANLLILPIGLSNEQREDLLPILATTNGEILGYL